MRINHYTTLAEKRKRRVRAKISGTKQRPRLTVFRSNKHIWAQVINDEAGKTLVAACDLGKDNETAVKGKNKTQKAQVVADQLLAKLKKAKIKKLVFDRGSYKYHGRVKAIAESLRAGGVEI